ncbi:CAAX prenyl protease 1 [Galdieria sulphuraria]|nr:CAAX prenyl protease 1 [Galdieria sulphuraria]
MSRENNNTKHQVGIAVIGAGRIGLVHCEALTRVPGVQLVAVADFIYEAATTAAEKFHIPLVFQDWKEVLKLPQVHGIVVCSPSDTHADIIVAASRAGKHIFCEKPIDYDLKRIDLALTAVERAGILFQLGFQRRFDANFRRVREAVKSGEVGTPYMLHIVSRDPAPPPISYIKQSGGLFFDMMTHDFDMARFCMGSEIVEVTSLGANLVDPAIGEAGDIDCAVKGCICNSQTIHRDLPLNFFMDRYKEAYAREMETFVDIIQNHKTPPKREQLDLQVKSLQVLDFRLDHMLLGWLREWSASLFSSDDNETTPYLQYVLLFQAGVSAVELYLDWRQRKCYELKYIPKELEKQVKPEKFQKAQNYGKDKNTFSILSEVIQTGVHMTLFATHSLPRLWKYCSQIIEKHSFMNSIPAELQTTLLFSSVLFLGNKLISLPFRIYNTFVLEQRYGFNKTTGKLFVKDLVTGTLISAVIGYPSLMGLWYVLELSGQKLWLYFWLFTSSLSILLALLYPPLIMPLFNKFQPLQDQKLRQEIEELATQRSSHSNAFMYGIWKKGIVLYDSLLEQNKDHDERILAVLAHEMGHWKMKHTQKMLLIGLLHSLVLSWSYGKTANNESIYRSFGFDTKAHIIGLLLFTEDLNIQQMIMQEIWDIHLILSRLS